MKGTALAYRGVKRIGTVLGGEFSRVDTRWVLRIYTGRPFAYCYTEPLLKPIVVLDTWPGDHSAL